MLRDNTYHPFEIALSGYSGSGKTTLIMKLIEELSVKYKIGYIKHDAHHFDMDKDGKDTDKATKANASLVSIHNDSKWADQGRGIKDIALQKLTHINNDFVLVEGHKKTSIPKIIILGEEKQSNKILNDFKDGTISNVIAIVGIMENSPLSDVSLPYFQRDNYQEITSFILEHFSKIYKSRPLNGLILAGGKSKRMQTDKGAIKYHGEYQVDHIREMLSSMCQNVYVSCRSEQTSDLHMKNTEQIFDQYIDMGPMGGILSAMKKDPTAAWLVVACDLPYLNKETISDLIEKRNPFKTATCFLNPIKKWPEPLCSIYEPKASIRLFQYLAIGYKCPRKVLFNSEIKTLELETVNALDNANTPTDYELAMDYIQNKQNSGATIYEN